MQQIRIVIFSRSYSGIVGGVEKLSLRIAKLFVSKGFLVHLVSFDEPDAVTYFTLPEGVIWHKIPTSNIDIKSSWSERFRRILAIRHILKDIRPDLFIGFQVGSFLIMRISAFGLNIASVAAERNAPTLFKYIRLGKLKYFFYQISLISADIIAVQFSEYRNLYILPNRARIRITPNSVCLPENGIAKSEGTKKRRLLYAGRLTFQKNVEVLLEALVDLEREEFSLTIVGDGPSRSLLEDYAGKHGLDVEFHPFQGNLVPFFQSHDLLCLPSRWEGFPNILAEAMAHGLPVVGFEEAAGVSSLIIPGVNGELASGMASPQALAKTLAAFKPTDYSHESIVNSIMAYDDDLFESSWLAVVYESLRVRND